ncbi:MAG: hypothetical protein ACLPH3_12370 [Terracidiphilus sp.]
MQKGVELFLGDGADGDQIVAEPTALLSKACEGFRNVVVSDELCADQQIP